MRKLILTVTLAILSVGAYAQGTPANNCTPTPNNPAIGSTYKYEVGVSGGMSSNQFNGGGTYHWYVTQTTNLLDETSKIDATNNYFSVENGTTYGNAAGTNKSLELKWKPDALQSATPFYLVLRYAETQNGCNATNIKAMEIKPLNNFKINIIPVSDANGADFTGNAQVCSADITAATIENGKVKYIYGENKLYYKVTMTGFTGEWKPTITLPNLAGKDNTVGRKYVSVKWNENGTFENFGTLDNNGNTQTITSTNKTNKTEFILEVTIDNGTYEGLNDETVSVATKGQMVLANGDLGRRDVNDNCEELTVDKTGEQVILARPTIQAQSGEFIIQIQ